MAKSVVRGKALVAKLRMQAGVRDPEALAAWIGRFKKLRKAGKSIKEAQSLAGKVGGLAKGSDATRPAGKDRPSKPSPLTRRNTQGQTRVFSGAKARSENADGGSTARNRSELEGIKARGGIMGLPKGGLGPEANARAREENRKAGFRGATGDTDPKKMTDAELDYFINANEMANKARAQTPEVRQKTAARLLKLWKEKKRREGRRAQGYKW